MSYVHRNVCAFVCARQRDCGGWECKLERRSESAQEVRACVPTSAAPTPRTSIRILPRASGARYVWFGERG